MNPSHQSAPKHVAIIMDGNRRWARQHKLRTIQGHRHAVDKLRDLIEMCHKRGITYLTLFAFSKENWQRPPDQVQDLMTLFMETIEERREEVFKNDVIVRFIGDRTQLNPSLVQKMDQLEHDTTQHHGIHVIIALDYSGRWDMTQATQKLLDARNQTFSPTDHPVSENELVSHMQISGLPDPDLLIRTSGEMRISNFLLWSLAYTELYFTPTLFPDFGEKELDDALAAYHARERRFGGNS